MRGRMLIWIYYTLFSFVQVLSHWVLLVRFLMRQLPYCYDHPRGSVRKYENLSDYENLWIIIYIDVYLFMTPYIREIPLIKYIIFSSYILISLSCFLLLSFYNFTTLVIFLSLKHNLFSSDSKEHW